MKRIMALHTLIAAAAAVVGLGSARAGETCYDFSNQSIGQTFLIGSTVTAEHLKVRIIDYKRDGQKATPAGAPTSQFVEVKSPTLAGGSPPELYAYLATMVIQPRSPVAQIRMRVGESVGGSYQGHANIELNGSVHEVIGTLAQLDGREFGNASTGRVRLEVQMASRGGNRNDGTLKARAVAGKIKSFGIGGAALAVDDVCFTPNAP